MSDRLAKGKSSLDGLSTGESFGQLFFRILAKEARESGLPTCR
jgi:hypothetical protein